MKKNPSPLSYPLPKLAPLHPPAWYGLVGVKPSATPTKNTTNK